MYREYRDMPVINRTCTKACRDRAYQKHLEALRKTKATINTKSPRVPRTVGLNLKRNENEKQRKEEIARENQRLLNDLENIQHRKKSPDRLPQTRYTLRGYYHTEQAEQIDKDNLRLANALYNQKPNISQDQFYAHKCDHIYQVNKMSIYKKTIPMSQIMRQKLPPMEGINMPKSTRSRAPRKIPHLESKEAPNTSRDNLFITNKGNNNQLLQIGDNGQDNSKAMLDEIIDDQSNMLIGNKSKNSDDYDDEIEEDIDEPADKKQEESSKEKLTDITKEASNLLIGQNGSKQDQNSNEDENQEEGSEGKLTDITKEAGNLLLDQKDATQNEDSNDDANFEEKSDEKSYGDENSKQEEDQNEGSDSAENSNDDEATNDSDGKLNGITKEAGDLLLGQKDAAQSANSNDDENSKKDEGQNEGSDSNDSNGRLDVITKEAGNSLFDKKPNSDSERSRESGADEASKDSGEELNQDENSNEDENQTANLAVDKQKESAVKDKQIENSQSGSEGRLGGITKDVANSLFGKPKEGENENESNGDDDDDDDESNNNNDYDDENSQGMLNEDESNEDDNSQGMLDEDSNTESQNNEDDENEEEEDVDDDDDSDEGALDKILNENASSLFH